MPKKDQKNPIEPAGANPETTAETTAVAERDPTDVSTYRILNRSEDEIVKALDIFRNNLRGQKLTERDLPRVKTPPQGITIWTIPNPEGDSHAEELVGILVEYTTPRAYWDKPMEPGSVMPPVCSSPDGIHGTRADGKVGKPGEMGGPCHLCPFSKFGSDPRPESNGQACKEKRMLFLLRPDSLLPIVVQAPSTSIRNVFDYTMGLGNQETPFQHVYTALTLEKIATGGIEYSKVVLKNLGQIPGEYHPQLESYGSGLSRIIETQTVEVEPDPDNTVIEETVRREEETTNGEEATNTGDGSEGQDPEPATAA